MGGWEKGGGEKGGGERGGWEKGGGERGGWEKGGREKGGGEKGGWEKGGGERGGGVEGRVMLNRMPILTCVVSVALLRARNEDRSCEHHMIYMYMSHDCVHMH